VAYNYVKTDTDTGKF